MPKRQEPRLTSRNGLYYISYHDGQRSRRISTRTSKQEEAQIIFGHWLAEGGAQVKEATKDPVLMDVVRDWYENVVYLEQPTWLRTRSVLRALDGFFGEMRISQVNGKVIKEYVASRQPRSSGTVRLELQKIRTAFNWACTRKEPRDERLRREELPWIELPSASAPRNTVVERQLLAQMRDNAIDMALGLDRPFGIYLLMLIETAMRKTAVLELRWEQVDFSRRLITFNQEGRIQTKKHRPTIPMSKTLEQVLRQLAEDQPGDGLVCGLKRDPFEKFKQWAAGMGMPQIHPHVFRHTWATHAAEDGVAMNIIAGFLGDTVKTVEKNYLHLSPDYLRQAVDR